MIRVNPNIFKAYDIRGIYPDELDEEVAYKIGRAFVEFLKRKYPKTENTKLKIIVGRDARPSSPLLFQSFSNGILDSDVDVINIGLSTTPLLYFSVNIEKADGGAMITASHIPPPHNGLKLSREKAFPIGRESGLREIQNILEKEEFKKILNRGEIIEKNFLEEYINFIAQDVKIKNFKIVADTGNGMVGLVLPKLFRKLKINYVPLYFELDGTFPNHEANPIKEETLKDLINRILKEQADLGVAFDGDGDRIRFITQEGEPIRGDLITALLAEEFLRQYPGSKILYNAISSRVVKETIEKNRGIPIRSRVGHAFIKQLMDEEGIIFAGETSGHYFFHETFNRESAVLAMIKVLNIMTAEGKSFSELIKPFQKYFITPEINFTVEDMQAKIKEVEKCYADAKIDYLDGLTVEYSDWWFNLRPSGSEPILRLNLEASTKELYEQKIEEVKDIIETK